MIKRELSLPFAMYLALAGVTAAGAGPDVIAPSTLDGYPVCEASAAIDFPCIGEAGRCAMVADNESKKQIFQYKTGDDGRLTKAQAWKIHIGDVEVEDAEALIQMDSGLLMIGSHSRKKSCERDEKRLRMARLDPKDGSSSTLQATLVIESDAATWADRLAHCDQQIIAVPESECDDQCQRLRKAVCGAITDAESAADKAIGQLDDPCDKVVHSFNIEGAAPIADASGKRRNWMGLRAPLVDGKAVLLRLAPLGTGPNPPTFDGVATIDLGGMGVRELATRDGWLWGIAGTAADSSEPSSRLWRVKEDAVRSGARIDSVQFMRDRLPPSAEGLVIDAFSNRALIVIDGDMDKDNKKCAVDAQQLVLLLGPSGAIK